MVGWRCNRLSSVSSPLPPSLARGQGAGGRGRVFIQYVTFLFSSIFCTALCRMMSKYIELWSRRRFCLSQVSGFPGFHKQGQRTMPKRLQTAARTDRNDSKDLLLLLAYAKKLQETQRNLEDVCNLMQHKVPLEGLISAQDNRTLQSAKSCLQRFQSRSPGQRLGANVNFTATTIHACDGTTWPKFQQYSPVQERSS